MTAIVYATRADLDDFGGIPDGALANAGREVASSTASTNIIELDAHGFATDDEVLLRAAEGGTLSAPLVAGTTYFAIRLSDSTFKVAATSGGAAIDLSTNGVSMIATKPLPIDRMLELYSRWVEGFLPAHLVPVPADDDGAFPIEITAIVARLAGKALLNLNGKASEIVDKAEIVAMAQLARWATGIPLRDAGITASANLAVTSTLGNAADSRGWCGSGGSGSLP